MYIFEIDFNENQSQNQENKEIEIFLADCILHKLKKKRSKKKFETWLELLEVQKIKKLGCEYLMLFDEYGEDEKEQFNMPSNKPVEREPGYYGYVDKNGKFIDRFEIARRKRKAKQRIFDRISWGIFFFGLLLTIGFVFFWEMSFIEYVIYFTSLWINVYIVMGINYLKLKDLPRPFVCNQITL